MSRTMTVSWRAIAVAFGASIAIWGCRSPEEEAGYTPPTWEPDAGIFEGDVGALCPAGSPELFNNAFSPFEGGDDSVDLVVNGFSSFGCPVCASFAAKWAEIVERRADIRARVRFYFHHVPAVHGAWDQHDAAIAVANQSMDGFWQLHDYIFTSISDQGIYRSLDEIRAYCADVLHLDMERFEQDLADPDTAGFADWDQQQGLDAGITGTPSVFICGQKISWPDIESVIDGYLNP